MAGVVGPVVVNYMRQWQLGLGLPAEQVYSQTMLILAAMLAVGLACNLQPATCWCDRWMRSGS